MTSDNAKSQAWGTREPEERAAESTLVSTGQAGARGDSFRVSGVGVGIVGAAREKENFGGSSLGGKIIAQLIQEAEDQLGNARECVDWYQREEQKILAKLERLRQMQQEQASDDL